MLPYGVDVKLISFLKEAGTIYLKQQHEFVSTSIWAYCLKGIFNHRLE